MAKWISQNREVCTLSNILFWIILCGQSLIQHGMPDGTIVVLAGLTNTYADYIATYEEYQVRTARRVA